MFGLRAGYRDIQNYREWIKVIKREKSNLESAYNKFGFSHNYTYMIYLVLTLDHTEGQLPDNIQRARIIEKLGPVNRYLDDELTFAEYLVPEFSQIFEDDEATLSYVIAYRFAFQTIGLWWTLKRIVLFSGLTFIGFKIPWVSLYETVSTWISTLI